jgi:hypothetical protein
MHHLTCLAFACTSLAFAATGCLPSISDLDSGPLTKTFALSDYYTPSGYMGDGANFGSLVGQTNAGCKPRPAGARGNCYVFTYYPNHTDSEPWAGVFWVFPANNWGSSYGHAIDSTRFKQVRFYAAIEGPTPYTVGGSVPNLKLIAGTINDPNGTYTQDGNLQHIDGIGVTTSKKVGSEVTTELKQFHMPIDESARQHLCNLGPPYSDNCATVMDANGQPVLDPTNGSPILYANDLIGGFAWALPYPRDSVQCADGTTDCRGQNKTSQFVNPKPVKIYFDDIVWDTEPAPATP